MRFCDALELAWVATSLGGTHTLVGPRGLDHAPADGPGGAARGRHRRRADPRERRPRGRRGPHRRLRPGPGEGMTTRRRVAVLFGGRRAEHEISCISARSVIDALDPERIEVIPIGITREGRWHLLSGPPRAARRDRPDAGGHRRRRARPWSSPRERARASSWPPTAARADRRRVPGAARPYGRGRRRPGHAGARRRALRRAPASWLRGRHGQGVQKALFAAAGLPVGALRGRARAASGARTRGRRGARRGARLPAVRRSRPTLGSSVGIIEGPRTATSSPPRSTRRSATTRKARRRARRRGRPRDRVRRARQRRPGRVGRRRDRPDGRTSSTTTRPSTSTTTAPAADPRRPRPPTSPRRSSGMAVAAFRAIECAGHGPRRLLRASDDGAGCRSTRSTRSRGSRRSRCTRSCGRRAGWPTPT